MKSDSWITVCGKVEPQLQREIEGEVARKLSNGEYSHNDIKYIAALKRPLFRQGQKLDKENLETIRRLCSLWDVRLDASQIKSHRRFIGPVIVAIKKALLPIIRSLMKDYIKKQRDFNGEVVKALAAMSATRQMEEERQ